MRAKTISYQKSFVIGPYLQEKIGVEVEISETDSPTEVFLNAKTQVEEWHRSTNPGLYMTNAITGEVVYGTGAEPRTPAPLINEPRTTVDYLISDVNSCDSLKVLETYKFIAKSNPAIQEAYDKKLKELS